ncbi:MAG: GTPase Era [Gammaproteobacteria bacterium]|nr:GTPase Era [Gammaproteobacteria bacterium]MCH9743551.1 GTPase Era [Gammaproteobacteria bacterium]
MKKTFRSGYIALIGKPNVGKSTLLNTVLGKKLSITANKPQTTRHRLVGIKNDDNAQFVFVDTPGLHVDAKRAMNKWMNRSALTTLLDVDVIILMIEAGRFGKDDEWALQQLQKIKVPVILAVNKVDKLDNKNELLPFIQMLSEKYDFKEIVPISARSREQVDILLEKIHTVLPEGPPLYPLDQLTDRNDQFIVSERLREKITRQLGEELPYASTVTIDIFEEEQDIMRVAATIWVEREGQKAIVIGKKGERLKQIGTSARLELEEYFNKKVFLKLWVKVKSNWSDDERAMNQLGYRNE